MIQQLYLWGMWSRRYARYALSQASQHDYATFCPYRIIVIRSVHVHVYECVRACVGGWVRACVCVCVCPCVCVCVWGLHLPQYIDTTIPPIQTVIFWTPKGNHGFTNFFTKKLSSVFLEYRSQQSCQVSWRSLERLSRKSDYRLTTPGLTSTNVENSKPNLNWRWELQRAHRTNLTNE